jgi:mono/diheme cytochrome c family protein
MNSDLGYTVLLCSVLVPGEFFFMKKNHERSHWALCFGVLGALTLGGAVLVSAPQKAEAQQPPAANNGVAQFNRTCGRCHPNGNEDTGPDLHNLNKTEAEMTKIIRSGSKRMKAIAPAKLSNADLTKVMVFLRSLHAVR